MILHETSNGLYEIAATAEAGDTCKHCQQKFDPMEEVVTFNGCDAFCDRDCYVHHWAEKTKTAKVGWKTGFGFVESA